MQTAHNHALMNTLRRINWTYGKGDLRELTVDGRGRMVAVIDRPTIIPETAVYSFPKPGFVRFRGQTRKIRTNAA